MNTTEQPVITSESVAAWMKQQLAKLVELAPSGPVSFDIDCNNFYPGQVGVTFKCYCEKVGSSAKADNADEAIEYFRKFVGAYNPAEKVEQLRKEAHRMMAEAEKLEQAI